MPQESRRKQFILTTVLVAPLATLFLLELMLLVSGYRSPFVDEDPYLGFSENSPLFERTVSNGQPVYATRERKLRWFNQQEFLAEKPSNGYRIFSLGGSTTYGRPYADPTSFSGWLRVILSHQDSTSSYEVVNAGGVSYASYRVINLMKEIIAYEPDLLVVYTGNNEFLEERTYGAIKNELPLITTVRGALQNLRTYGLVRDAIAPFRGEEDGTGEGKFQMSTDVDAILDQSVGIDRYHRDTVQTARILDHFRLNLNRMVDIAEESGVPILFVVPSTNEKDFSPFKSAFQETRSPEEAVRWHRIYDQGVHLQQNGKYPEALTLFEMLKKETPEHADVRYRFGRSLFAAGEFEAAKQEFVAARDNDVAPLRATSRIQQIVRDVASGRGVPVIDLQEELERSMALESGHRCLGEEFFYDHCHPTIEVHQRIAERIWAVIAQLQGVGEPAEPLSPGMSALYNDVLTALEPEYFGVRDLNIAKVLRWAGKKKEADPFVRRAAQTLPDHPEAWYLLGISYQEEGSLDSAALALKRSISLDPSNAKAYNSLGSVSMGMGNVEDAVHLYGEAISRNPVLNGVYYNLGNALVRQGSVDQAILAYREELRINPRNILALNNLGFIYLNRREFDIAAPLFEETIALDPQNIEAYSNLGIVAIARDDPDEAARMFRQVLSIRPGDQFAIDWMNRLAEAKLEGIVR